jgi:cbb3-type cytochrome oxidase subunit 3
MIFLLTLLFWGALVVGMAFVVWLWFAYGAAMRAMMDGDDE